QQHIWRTLVLGVPLVGVQLASVAIQTTDLIMVGRLGASELAAVSLSGHLIFLCFFAALGFTSAVMAVAAEGEGANDPQTVRRAARMGIWIVSAIALLFMPVYWNAQHVLLVFGQAPEVAALAQEYLRVAMFSMFPIVWLLVARSYLSSVDHTQILMWVTVAGIALNALLNYAFIFGNWGAPELGVRGAAIATVGSNAFMLAGTIVYAAWHPLLKKYDVFRKPLRGDRAMVKRIFLVGWPISVTVLAEGGLFIAASFLIGWFGVLELAAHTIALQVATVAFMIPFGLSGAVTVRVGQAYGRGDSEGVGKAGYAGLALTAVTAGAAALIFLLFAPQLVRLFIGTEIENAANVVLRAVPLLYVAGAFQLADGLQVMAAAILRGLQDTRIPMLIAVVSYWGVGLLVGAIFGFGFGLGALGMWLGLAAGLLTAGILLVWRFTHREQYGLLDSRVAA
ncbi:MAG: MATE family efflux transporter, partial [Pseudomonadota bacterium]